MSTSRQRRLAREKAKTIWPNTSVWRIQKILKELGILTNESGFEVFIVALKHIVAITAQLVKRRMTNG